MAKREPVRNKRGRPQPQQPRLDTNHWYHINNARGAETHVYIYNEIGYWGITADDFVEALDNVDTGRITLHINSPGGSVFDGTAIYNALRDHPARVDVIVDGVAASAASFIAMAGDTITMNRGSEMMVHNAHGLTVGDSAAMREMANLLDRQNKKIARIYKDRAGGPIDHWLGAMEAESWYDPGEAVAAGLADRAVVDSDAEDNEAKKAARNFSAPEFWAYTSRDEAGPPPETPDDDPELDDDDDLPTEDPSPPDPDVADLEIAPLPPAAAQTNNHQIAALRAAFADLTK